jgi:putative FmdB family regulatory protein
MPLYPYTCDDCGHAFEKVMSRAAVEPAVSCPECHSPRVVRQFGLPAATSKALPATNCRGNGPPCGAIGCGRITPR